MQGDPARVAAAFAALLRDEGVPVPVGSVVTFVEAIAAVGLDRRERVYWAGRAVMLGTPEHIPAYDRAFSRLWMGAGVPTATATPPPAVAALSDPEAADGDEAAAGVTKVRYSPVELLREKDFAEYSPEEMQELRRLFARVRLQGSLRRTRRHVAAPRRGPSPDLRRTLRRSMRHGGEPLDRAYRERALAPRRVVLLCDVSASMDVYSRALIRFVHAAVAARARVEAFALGTRLTRLTRDLTTRDPDAALRRVAFRVPDYSGGTRLGEAVKAFNDRWGVRGMARGAVVVVLSDGWDRGDPALLAAEMERLHRVAHRVVWVNPLKSSTGYAPLARGMAAALPHVDDFVEGHSIASLEALAEVIAG